MEFMRTEQFLSRNRIHTGFHRIGLLLGCVLALPALVLAGTEVVYRIIGDGRGQDMAFIWAIPAIGAVIVYVVARGIGWIVDGFITPSKDP